MQTNAIIWSIKLFITIDANFSPLSKQCKFNFYIITNFDLVDQQMIIFHVIFANIVSFGVLCIMLLSESHEWTERPSDQNLLVETFFSPFTMLSDQLVGLKASFQKCYQPLRAQKNKGVIASKFNPLQSVAFCLSLVCADLYHNNSQ